MRSDSARKLSSAAIRRRHRIALWLAPFAATVGVVGLLGWVTAEAAQAPVGLGTAGSFAVLAGSGITNTGATTIVGDVGTFPTPAETGFTSVTLIGTDHGADAVTQQAKSDLTNAYNVAAGSGPGTAVATELGGTTLTPGVYTADTLAITGTLTLDTLGDPTAVFIFQSASTLITASGSSVVVLGGSNACNVFWQIGSSATLGTGSQLIGSLLALTSITANAAATIRGRLLAQNGAVTLEANTITSNLCAPPTTTTVTTTGTPTPTFTVPPTSTTVSALATTTTQASSTTATTTTTTTDRMQTSTTSSSTTPTVAVVATLAASTTAAPAPTTTAPAPAASTTAAPVSAAPTILAPTTTNASTAAPAPTTQSTRTSPAPTILAPSTTAASTAAPAPTTQSTRTSSAPAVNAAPAVATPAQPTVTG